MSKLKGLTDSLNSLKSKPIVVQKPDPAQNVVMKLPASKSNVPSRVASPEIKSNAVSPQQILRNIQPENKNNAVQVALRLRPLNDREKSANATEPIKVLSDKSLMIDAKQYTYDYVYNNASQQQIFTDLGEPLVTNALSGFNCAVFAYGQTSSGKTFTMMGSQENTGLIPRICTHLFQTATESTNVQISYVEIYDDKIYDLLNANNSDKIEVKEHPKKGVYMDNATVIAVSNYQKMKIFIEKGNQARTVGETKMNRESSRSHAILTIYIEQKTAQGTLRSKINLVDLAGSERVKRSGVTGKGAAEAVAINQSLSTLSRVINAVVENQTKNKKHVPPFRECKLTMMLKECIGGNSKTIMIANISPASDSIAETIGTLEYANSVKKIINSVQVNIDSNLSLVESLQQEIENLRNQINTGKTEKGAKISNDEINKLKEQLQQAEKLHKDANTSWEEKLSNAEKIYNDVIIQLKKTHEEEKHKLVVESQKRVDDILHTRRLSEEVGAQKFQLEMYQSKIKELTDTVEILNLQMQNNKSSLDSVYTIHAKEKDALTSEIIEIKKRHQEIISKLNLSRELEIANIRDKYEGLIADQKRETETYKAQVTQMNIKHQSQKDHLAKQLELEKKLYEEKITKDLTEIYARQEEAYELQTFKKISEEIKTQFETQLKLKILESERELDDQYKQKYTDLIQNQQNEIENLKLEYERKIAELQTEHQITLNSSLESLKMEMAQAAQIEREQMQSEMLELQRTVTSTRNEADMHIIQIRESNMKFAQELEKKYLNEIEELQKSHQESKIAQQTEIQKQEKRIRDLSGSLKTYQERFGVIENQMKGVSHLSEIAHKLKEMTG